MKTIDWRIVENFIVQRKPISVSAGILCDWYSTSATVYENGEWLDRSEAWVSSAWAAPGFKAKMENGDTIVLVAFIEQD